MPLLFILASAPDFVGLRGPYWFLLFLVLAALNWWLRAGMRGAEIDAYRGTFEEIGHIVSSISGESNRTRVIESLLAHAVELAEKTLSAPAGAVFSAHLILPVQDSATGRMVGLRAEFHDLYRPARCHEIIPLDAPGAGVTFQTGQPAAIPNTNRTTHPRPHNRPYQSVGSFPVVVVQPGLEGKVIAVVSIDATREEVFTDETVATLQPFVSPIAQLMGLALTMDEDEKGGEHG